MTGSCLPRVSIWAPLFAALLALAGPAAALADDAAGETVDFNTHIRPIFNHHCISCHGGVKQASGLSFIRRNSLLAEAESGEVPVKPGDPDGSELLRRVTAEEYERMPPADHGKPLQDKEIELLRKWISQGAKWGEHWAYVKPDRGEVPQVAGDGYVIVNSIDNFVAAPLQAAGLTMSPPADRRTWLRRATFDLTGLPPTPDEINDFLADDSPEAYEKVVDRLLASPAYGERWASMWLDLARYADTVGFERDPHRNIWPYRDWLIRAFNDDMPYDEFTVKQLAGDLLPDPSLDDLIATAFHRNTQTNTEGGTDDEEFRTQAVIDRVNTTWQVWMGTTFGCTQCHSHPYAPIDHVEYYEVMAFFNNTRDSDVREELPLLDVPLEEAQREEARHLDRRISRSRRRLFRQFSRTAKQAEKSWRDLAIAKADSTGTAKLRIKPAADGTEIWSEGTITNHPRYTLEAPLPAQLKQLTALRIEVLPEDPKAALQTPEDGFVLSRLEGQLLREQEKPAAIRFRYAFSDEAEPLLDPEESLSKSHFGWGEYSRISRPRSAVFLLEKPLDLRNGDRIRLKLSQTVVVDGSAAMVIRRGRFAVSGDARWSDLVASDTFIDERAALDEAHQARNKIKHVSVPVMQEIPAHLARHTFRFERGNWLDKGQRVEPDTPSIFAPLADSGPRNRLAFARWLVSPENPLTARVMVNRLWIELFGLGLVETAEDFGSSGTPPSNQALLDHLAVRFQEDFDWSMKRLLREIVLSATYRQTAKAPEELWKRDPNNQLLARGPRTRLTAEMVRDQALAASGLLSRKMYGPPVMPPQPDGIWRSVYNGGKWTNATGEDRYRRAVYTYWKRTSGYPSFMAFDMPSRELCSVRRIVTNTPLQALAALNDEAHIEFAQALGRRMHDEVGGGVRHKLQWAYTLVTCHEPTTGAIDDLAGLYEEALEVYQQNDSMSERMGESPETAALAAVANAILNLDSALTK